MQDFCVVGAGRMGASIAGQLVLQGARVALFDRSDYDRKKGYEIMRADMKELEQRGLILPADKDAALARISLVENHDQCVQAKVVVEAIFEDLDAKRSLFTALEAAAARSGANPVLSSNSMNYSIGQITSGVTSSARVVCGLRFLFPVFFMRPVEVSGHELCTDDRLSPDMSHLFASLRSFGFEPFYKSFPKPSLHGGQYQGSCRRTLGPHEVQLYEGEQARVVRTRMAEIEKAGGVVSRPAQGEVAWVKGERDLIIECLICMESTDNALFAPCGHRNLCMKCASTVFDAGRPCPTCRQRIERMLRADTDEPAVNPAISAPGRAEHMALPPPVVETPSSRMRSPSASPGKVTPQDGFLPQPAPTPESALPAVDESQSRGEGGGSSVV